MIKNIILALVITSAFFACVGDIGTTLKSDEVNRLLTGGSAKFWLRTARTEDGTDIDVLESCETGGLLVFVNYADVADTAFYATRYSPENCTDEQPLLFSRSVYTLASDINSNFENRIEFSMHDFDTLRDMEVLDLTTRFLKVKYFENKEDGKEVIEVIEIFNGSAENQPESLELTFDLP